MNISLKYEENNAVIMGEMGKQAFNINTDYLDYIEEPEAWQLEDLDDVILSYE